MKIINMTLKRLVLLIIGIVFSFSLYANEPEKENTLTLQAGWANNYLSEGRENLPSEGLLTFEALKLWKGLEWGAWLGVGDASSYKELNVWVSYPFQIEPIEIYIGYCRLAFLDSDESDNEVVGGLSAPVVEHLSVFTDAAYSTEQSGTFVELGVEYSFELLNGSLELTPYMLEGFDFGYATKPFDGANHFQYGLQAQISLLENGFMVFVLSNSNALRDIKLEGGKNTSEFAIHFGLNL